MCHVCMCHVCACVTCVYVSYVCVCVSEFNVPLMDYAMDQGGCRGVQVVMDTKGA